MEELFANVFDDWENSPANALEKVSEPAVTFLPDATTVPPLTHAASCLGKHVAASLVSLQMTDGKYV